MEDKPNVSYTESLSSNSKLHAAISKTVNQVIEKTDLSLKHAPPESSGHASEEKSEHVKRPMNAFMVYARAARKELALQYPNLSYRKLSKILGQLWKMLDEKEKQPFIEEAERLRRKHRSEHPDYKYQPKKKSKKARNMADETRISTSPSVPRKVSITHELSRKVGEEIMKSQSVEPRFPTPSWNYDSLALQAAAVSLPMTVKQDSYRTIPSQFSPSAAGINQYLSVTETLDNNKRLFSSLLTEAAQHGGLRLEETNKNVVSSLPTGSLREPSSRLLDQYSALQRPITAMTGRHEFGKGLSYFPSNLFQKTPGLFEGEQHHQVFPTVDRLVPATSTNRTRGELFLRI